MSIEHYQMLDCSFTLRQMQVIALCATGMQPKQVALALDIATGTVKSHLVHIRNRLRIDSYRLLIVKALENGFDSQGHFMGQYLLDGIDWQKWLPK